MNTNENCTVTNRNHSSFILLGSRTTLKGDCCAGLIMPPKTRVKIAMCAIDATVFTRPIFKDF